MAGTSTPSWANWTSSPETYGASTPKAANTAEMFQTVGPILAIAGMATSAIGAYYAAKTQQYQLESQALTNDFQKSMSELNAKNAEFTAQTILESGQRQIGAVTMRAGNVKGAARASMAARGIQAGVGSAADVIATTDLMKEVDVNTINARSVQAAEAQRMAAVNSQNQAMMAGVSADNARMGASTINPFMASTGSLLGSASTVASAYYQDKRMAAYENWLAKQQ
jgi:hypothetical protein